ncbi:MAG: hypothetical protein ACOYNY_26325 [Caldilineaceae bacterium]|jgi:hypothetical protein
MITTLVTGIAIGAGSTWLLMTMRQPNNPATTTVIEETTVQPEPVATAKRRWQLPSFGSKQTAVVNTPAAVVKETPTTNAVATEAAAAA